MQKSYRVSGPHRVLGHEPGAVFEGVLDPDMEERLLAGGQLKVEKPAAKKTPDPEPYELEEAAIEAEKEND